MVLLSELWLSNDGGMDMNDDAVSRQKVIEILNHQRFGVQKMSWDIISEKISELPSVTPKQRKGHWTYICNSSVNGLKIVKCSNCNKRAYGSTDFCPNCGADMRESEEQSTCLDGGEYADAPTMIPGA